MNKIMGTLLEKRIIVLEAEIYKLKRQSEVEFFKSEKKWLEEIRSRENILEVLKSR